MSHHLSRLDIGLIRCFGLLRWGERGPCASVRHQGAPAACTGLRGPSCPSPAEPFSP